jgi:hypothetical protein
VLNHDPEEVIEHVRDLAEVLFGKLLVLVANAVLLQAVPTGKVGLTQ